MEAGGLLAKKALKGEGCKIMKKKFIFMFDDIDGHVLCGVRKCKKISEDDTTQDVTEDSSKDDDILAFLKTNNVINSDDTYMGVDRGYRNIRKRG